MEKLYTVEELAEILKVTDRTIFRMIKNQDRDKRLPAAKVGRRWLIKESDFQEFINRKVNENK